MQTGTVHEESLRGIFLTQEELLTLFSLLKRNEALLKNTERQLLVKIERELYEHLSIADLESRLGGLC
jgi:hypothetical protein